MPTLYVRVSAPVHDWIMRQASKSGLSMATVVEAVIGEAMRRGWQISPGPGPLIKDVQPQPPAPRAARGAAADLPLPPTGGGGPTGDGHG